MLLAARVMLRFDENVKPLHRRAREGYDRDQLARRGVAVFRDHHREAQGARSRLQAGGGSKRRADDFTAEPLPRPEGHGGRGIYHHAKAILKAFVKYRKGMPFEPEEPYKKLHAEIVAKRFSLRTTRTSGYFCSLEIAIHNFKRWFQVFAFVSRTTSLQQTSARHSSICSRAP